MTCKAAGPRALGAWEHSGQHFCIAACLKASSTSIDLLRNQHKEWQRAVDELLAGIRILEASGPVPARASDVTQKVAEVGCSPEASNEVNNISAHIDDEPCQRATFSRRSMSTESLLRLLGTKGNQHTCL